MRARIRRVAAVAATAAGVAAFAVTAQAGATQSGAAGRVTLPGSVAPMAAGARPLSAAPRSESLTVQVWLRPNLNGAGRFVTGVSTPGSASFRHFLTPAQYTARFGASSAAATAVRRWLVQRGFTHVRTEAQRTYVSATGSAGTVENAFAVRLNRYRVTSDGRAAVVQSNDRPVSVPKPLAGDILAVSGLNSRRAQPLHTAAQQAGVPSSAPCSHYWAEHTVHIQPGFRHRHRWATQNCGYSALRLRAAYGLAPRNSGKGQRVALIELGTPYKMVKTLTEYAKENGLPAPRPQQYQELSIGRGDACPNWFDVEEQLDVESVYAMAPRAGQLLVGGDTCDQKLEGVQPLFDAEQAVLSGTGHSPLASIESNSWGITGGETMPRTYLEIAHSILVRAAAEGVAMLFSSGDNPGVSLPSNDPLALAVGGTTLGIGKHNHRLFETGWSNTVAAFFRHKWHDFGIGRDAAGGGRSLLFGQPAYQKGVVPAGMSHVGIGRNLPQRVVPDISADADPTTGIGQIDTVRTKKGDRFVHFVDGGTSLASPLVAGILADAQQGHGHFGFVNPAIYRLAGTGALHDTVPATSLPKLDRGSYCPPKTCGGPQLSVYDSQRAQYTDQTTKRGFDTMTGLGTPAGGHFIAALRRIEGRR